MAPSGVLTGGNRKRARAASVGRPTWSFPVVDMIEVRLRTRSGCSIARICAIIPPNEIPTTCAEPSPRLSMRPAVSAAI
jgi:hypothetical protein